jgi:hypothetical protein
MTELTSLAKTKLDDLIQLDGPAKFGTNLQFVVASVLLHWGATKLQSHHPGHPDLECRLEGSTWRVEVEHLGKDGRDYSPDYEDIDAIRPREAGDHGYVFLLDLILDKWHAVPWSSFTPDAMRARNRLFFCSIEEQGVSNDLTEATERILASNPILVFSGSYDHLKRCLAARRFPWRMEW